MNDHPSSTTWPPDYQIRRSQRARRTTLKISPESGLEVILPMRAPLYTADQFVHEKRRWIEKHLPHALALSQEKEIITLPTDIELNACGEQWAIEYMNVPVSTQIITRPGYHLVVMGAVDNIALCHHALSQWVREKASIILSDRLAILSQSTALPYRRVSIRGQKTRWGSCSATGDISLNYKLIFFPPEVVRYVMVHELCHTIHLNHSARFWRLVEKHDPDYRTARRYLREKDQRIPSWVV